MRITRFGHAALLVEDAGSRILIDPGAYSAAAAFELTGLDAIVVTHQHPDHVDIDRLPALAEANPDARLIAEPDTCTGLREGDSRWSELPAGNSTHAGAFELTAVGGTHAVIHPEFPGCGNIGVLLRADDGPQLFHPGDSYDTSPEGVDILALPLTAPWAKLAETIEFTRKVKPGLVLPIHDRALASTGYGIYWQSIERLGHADRAIRLADDDSIDV